MSISERLLAEIKGMRNKITSNDKFYEWLGNDKSEEEENFWHFIYASSKKPRTEIISIEQELTEHFNFVYPNPFPELLNIEKWQDPWILKLEHIHPEEELYTVHSRIIYNDKVLHYFTRVDAEVDGGIFVAGQFAFDEEDNSISVLEGVEEKYTADYKDNLFFYANLFLMMGKRSDSITTKHSKNKKQKALKPNDNATIKTYISLSETGRTYYTNNMKTSTVNSMNEEYEKISVNVKSFWRRKTSSLPISDDNKIHIESYPSHRYISKKDKIVKIKK